MRLILRALGGAALLPLLPLYALEAVWLRVSPDLTRALTGPVRHRIAPARWAHEAQRRARIWWASRRRGP